MSKELELIQLLKEARKIIRASTTRGLHKDWDQRATAALAKPKPFKGPWDNPADFVVDRYPLERNSGFAPYHFGIKVTHTPTGVSHSCGTERSDHANRAIAWEQVQVALKVLKEGV